MKRLLLAGLAAVAITTTSASSAAAADADYTIAGGPHTAERAEDGTTTLELTVTNLGDRELELRLDFASARCSAATGKPSLDPYTSGKVTFTMSCEPGQEARDATLSPTIEGLSPANLPVEFTVEPQSESDWAVLWWFLLGAAFAAPVVVTAYGFWFFNPDGNHRKQADEPAASAASASPEPGRPLIQLNVDGADPRERADPTILRKQTVRDSWRARHPLTQLPGITKVWDFKSDWSSNVSLAAALFTAVLANTDPLEGILGEDATGALAVVTVAAALSLAISGTGPLWLVICKRRYEDNPAATDHTVAGVLMASFVVLWGSGGLILSVAVLVNIWQAWALAAISLLVLLLYTAKSIPMTLARGALPKKAEPTADAQPSQAPAQIEVSGMP